MTAFAARTPGALLGNFVNWLLRGVTYSVPTLLWGQQWPLDAVAAALFLGLLDGWSRLRLARTARAFVAETDGLIISSGFESIRVAWANLLAVEVWHRMNRLDYAAVHYRTPAGNVVATCWEQDRREELLRFVRSCAAFANAADPHRRIVRVHLGDRAVYLAFLQRLSLDVTVALTLGMLGGIASHALWLGATAGLVSASLAATPYLHRAELVLHDGIWWQRTKGTLEPLRAVPGSLCLWAGCLGEQGDAVARPVATGGVTST
jgi:hypothetical protein